MGKGEEFPAEPVEPCLDDSLDELMSHRLDARDPEFEFDENDKAGATLWAMPPDRSRSYVVVGDPGQSAPPFRNSPVVMVFDVTDYPEGAMVMRAFWWGDGGGKYEPWINQMRHWRNWYR